MKNLYSKEDNSVNFILSNGQECRYVERDNYFIIYLSSHSGCNQACRFCHLTQTKQTTMVQATLLDYIEQAIMVLKHWALNKETLVNPEKIHVNFMARGEPLLNDIVVNHWDDLSGSISDLITKMTGVSNIHFKISTIFPEDSLLNLGNVENFKAYHVPEFYYSLYSLDESFRKRWLPKAMPVEDALDILDRLYISNGTMNTIHYALIYNENDSKEDAEKISQELKIRNIPYKFNLVRYNPYSLVQGEEPTQAVIEDYLKILGSSNIFKQIKIVSRVGRDVMASCGMFFHKDNMPLTNVS